MESSYKFNEKLSFYILKMRRIIQISERLDHFKLRYLFSSKVSSISSAMTIFVFGLRIPSLAFCCSSVSSARFSGSSIIFRGSWYSISILLPSERTSVVGYVRSYIALCFFVIAAVQQLRPLRRPIAEPPIRASEATLILGNKHLSKHFCIKMTTIYNL